MVNIWNSLPDILNFHSFDKFERVFKDVNLSHCLRFCSDFSVIFTHVSLLCLYIWPTVSASHCIISYRMYYID